MVDEVRTMGWGGRLGRSVKGVLIGGVLFIASFPLLWWNEGNAVRTMKGLAEGASAVVSVGAEKVDGANEKKLVHFTGEATTSEELVDDVFAAAKAKAIRLERNCEIYQWKEDEKSETKKTIGGGERTEVTYEYQKVWSREPINSSTFHKDAARYRELNPVNAGSIPNPSRSWSAAKVTLGAFTLPPSLLDGLKEEPLEWKGDVPVSAAPQAPKVHAGGLYFGLNPSDPQIGDVRVAWNAVRPQAASVLGVQTGETVSAFTTSTGTTIFDLRAGTMTAAQMFQAAEAEATMMLWVFRLVGWLCMLIGLALVFEPLGVVMDVLPFLGSLARLGTGLFAGLFSLVLSLLTISFAWLFYRPLIGVPLLAAAVGLLVWMKMLAAKRGVVRA